MSENNICTCSRTKCKRHGNCELCRKYHKIRNNLPQCERITNKSTLKKLSDMTLEELWHLFPIRLTAPNPKWSEYYADMEKKLSKLLRRYRPKIHHIGSTAINGIWAKPIVDILAEFETSDNINSAAELLANNGFIVMNSEENRISLNYGYTENGFADKVYHIHLRIKGDCNEIYFRDYLNAHPDTAKEYEKLKLALWKKFEFNRDGYTEAKTEFVKNVLRQ